MKVTKRQLRTIIREAMGKRSRSQKIRDMEYDEGPRHVNRATNIRVMDVEDPDYVRPEPFRPAAQPKPPTPAQSWFDSWMSARPPADHTVDGKTVKEHVSAAIDLLYSKGADDAYGYVDMLALKAEEAQNPVDRHFASLVKDGLNSFYG